MTDANKNLFYLVFLWKGIHQAWLVAGPCVVVTVSTVESDSRTTYWGGEAVGVGGGGLRRLCLCVGGKESGIGGVGGEEKRRDEMRVGAS